MGSTAFAQGEPDPGTTPDPAADPAATDPAATTPDPAAPAVEDPAAGPSRWVRDIINRVLTYPKGIVAIGLDVAAPTKPKFFDPAFIKLSVGYGITDDFEINFVGYTLPTSEVGKGSIDGGLGYKLVRGGMGGKLEMIARVQTGYSLLSEGLNPIGVGVHVQYNVHPKVALITPGGQFQFGLADPKIHYFQLPIGIGFQITPTVYAQVDTTLMTIGIDPSGSAFIGADTTPVAITGYLNAMPALDIYAGLAMNLTPPIGGVGDTLAVLFGAKYYAGSL